MTTIALEDISDDFLQACIDTSMAVRDDYWFESYLNEKQNRIFAEIDEDDQES
jgi:hypothetical protein